MLALKTSFAQKFGTANSYFFFVFRTLMRYWNNRNMTFLKNSQDNLQSYLLVPCLNTWYAKTISKIAKIKEEKHQKINRFFDKTKWSGLTSRRSKKCDCFKHPMISRFSKYRNYYNTTILCTVVLNAQIPHWRLITYLS